MSTTTSQPIFEEHQQFRQPWLWILLAGIFVFLGAILGLIIFQVPDREGKPQAMVGIIIGLAVMAGTVVLMYALKLSVFLEGQDLHIRFFPLLRKTIPLADIVHWETRTYRPIVEYGGWGIRYSLWGKGWAYNVSGNQGVQLELANGKRILIGSQRAEELEKAIGKSKATS